MKLWSLELLISEWKSHLSIWYFILINLQLIYFDFEIDKLNYSNIRRLLCYWLKLMLSSPSCSVFILSCSLLTVFRSSLPPLFLKIVWNSPSSTRLMGILSRLALTPVPCFYELEPLASRSSRCSSPTLFGCFPRFDWSTSAIALSSCNCLTRTLFLVFPHFLCSECLLLFSSISLFFAVLGFLCFLEQSSLSFCEWSYAFESWNLLKVLNSVWMNIAGAHDFTFRFFSFEFLSFFSCVKWWKGPQFLGCYFWCPH